MVFEKVDGPFPRLWNGMFEKTLDLGLLPECAVALSLARDAFTKIRLCQKFCGAEKFQKTRSMQHSLYIGRKNEKKKKCAKVPQLTGGKSEIQTICDEGFGKL